jgi:serine protease Do
MNRERAKGVLAFFALFLIGLAVYGVFDAALAPSKPMVQEEPQPTEGVSKVAAQVSPSVVGITSFKRGQRVFDGYDSESTGSGVILDKKGHIVTNNHVVANADQLIVTLVDGEEREARIVGTDSPTDLAVIKIKGDDNLLPAEFGDSDKLVVGQEVVAIGNPLGLSFARSVTAGIVSGLNRLLSTEEGFAYRLIQTDAAINPGNSGGALVNLEGQIIGINSAKIAAEGFEGMGFAIPANQVKMVTDDLLRHGKVQSPILGVRIVGEISPEKAKYHRLPIHHGVVVEPKRGGPADKAGLKPFDIITRIDNQDVTTSLELQEAVFSKRIGQVVKVRLMHLPQGNSAQAQVKTVKVKLTE